MNEYSHAKVQLFYKIFATNYKKNLANSQKNSTFAFGF